MARTRDAITSDLRAAQKKLLAAKARRDSAKTKYYRAHLVELQKEYDNCY